MTQVTHIGEAGESLFLFPVGGDPADWATAAVAMTEGVGSMAGSHTGEADAGVSLDWYIVAGGDPPVDWAEVDARRVGVASIPNAPPSPVQIAQQVITYLTSQDAGDPGAWEGGSIGSRIYVEAAGLNAKLPTDRAQRLESLPAVGTVATTADLDGLGPSAPAAQVEDEPVSRSKTVDLVRLGAGLHEVDPLSLTVGDEDLLCAIDFAKDLTSGGRLYDVVSLEVVGAPAGLTIGTGELAPKRSGSQLKFVATATEATAEGAFHTLRARVRYHGATGTTTALVRVTVADAS